MAEARAAAAVGEVPADGEGPAVLLYTSGTTSAPKAAVLRHRHLTSYVIGTVEFAGAGPGEAVLVSVPPYHVAGLANLLSNLYLGRRIVYLPQFDAAAWVEAVRREGITNAMVVPTMLARICDVLEADGSGLPTLRALSYGGAHAGHRAAPGDGPAARRRAHQRLRAHRDQLDDRGARARRPPGRPRRRPRWRAPGCRRRGGCCPPSRSRSATGSAIRSRPASPARSGCGASRCRASTQAGGAAGAAGWFPTRDRGWLDDDGYLFIEGRSDDTIIRGGENIAPAEIEEVLLRHPDIAQCAVVGVPDDEWGQRIAAVVVPRAGAALDAAEVREFARRSLRGSKTPDVVTFAEALPFTETGKLLRRVVQADLLATP